MRDDGERLCRRMSNSSNFDGAARGGRGRSFYEFRDVASKNLLIFSTGKRDVAVSSDFWSSEYFNAQGCTQN